MGLYPFQVHGAEWLAARPRAYLADVMGLGKTIQAIAAVKQLGERAVGVACPASMIGTWEEEFRIWYPEAKPTVVSYDWLTRRRVLPSCSTFIVDEAHYCKNEDANRTRVTLNSVVEHHRTWFLSGTPMPNGPHELYTIVRRCLPRTMKRLGIDNYLHWLNTFCVWTPGEYSIRVFGPRNVPLLRRLLFETGFMLRRQFSDVELDLPALDLRRYPLRVKTPAEITMLEDLYGAEAMQYVNRGELPPEKSHTATLRRLIGEVKAKHAGALLYDELRETKHKVVVFAHHLSVLDTLENYLSPFGLVRLDGSVPSAKRMGLRNRFQNDPKVRVFLGQIKASGEGITLTAANDVVIVEPSWVPSDNDQAIARTRRIGQTKDTVYARMITVAGTLDDAILGVLLRKQATLNTIN